MNISIRIGKFLLLLVAFMYTTYRVYNVYQATPYWDDYDSPAYFKLEFFPSFRTHGITLVFYFLKNEFAISMFHAILGSLVWVYLWIVIWQILKNNALKFLFSVFYFTLASSSIVLEHDASILSESLAISSTVFLLACGLKVYLTKTGVSKFTLSIFGLAILWFASTKSSNSLIFPILWILFLFKLIEFKNRIFFFVSACFVTAFGFFIFVNTLSTDTTQSLNTSAIINNRIIHVEKWKEDLSESGYPDNAIDTWKDFSSKNLGTPPDQAVVDLPEFKQWWIDGGDNFIVRFIFRNYDYGLFAPLAIPLISNAFTYRDTLLSGWSQGTNLIEEHDGFSGTHLSRTFFWPDEPEKAYLFLALSFFLIGLSLLSFNFSKSFDYFNFFIAVLALTFLWSYMNWWFGSKPTDMARHNLSAAIVLKLLTITSIHFAIESVVNRKKSVIS